LFEKYTGEEIRLAVQEINMEDEKDKRGMR